jgi:hypothetical protein
MEEDIMRKFIVCFYVAIVSRFLFSQVPVQFEDYFLDQTLRVDFFQVGDAREEVITLDQIYKHDIWAGNPKNLIDVFQNGSYYVKVYDVASNKLIYSRGFSSIFREYQTTSEALEGVKRTFHESALLPCPKKSIRFVIESSDKKNVYHPIFIHQIDPSDVNIICEGKNPDDRVYEALKNGDPHTHVDLAWISEGYSAAQYDLFKADVNRYVDLFFGVEPYKTYKDRFNIYGVFRPSPESGVDQPTKGIFKHTTVNASFNALDTERYMLIDDNKAFRDVASCVPYDAAIIMVNIDRYGGGGIYNDYALSSVNHDLSPKVFVHEFGHSFAGLADEYYTSDVAYTDFYPKGVEPAEPNITALMDPEHIKWKALLTPGIDVPTDWSKDKIEGLQKQGQDLRKERDAEIGRLKAQGASKTSIQNTLDKYARKIRLMNDESKVMREKVLEKIGNKVGAFEGAGYSARGLYRSQMECLMFSTNGNTFCRVCQDAIVRMILFYSE